MTNHLLVNSLYHIPLPAWTAPAIRCATIQSQRPSLIQAAIMDVNLGTAPKPRNRAWKLTICMSRNPESASVLSSSQPIPPAPTVSTFASCRATARENTRRTQKNTESVARKKAQPKSDGEDGTLTHLDDLLGCGGHGGGAVQGFQRDGVWGRLEFGEGRDFGGGRWSRGKGRRV
jgi:hypothetical protein